MSDYRTLVSPAQLAQLMEQGDVLIFDCRFSLADFEAGRRAYAAGHLPGAFHADLNRDLSVPHQPGRTGRHPLPPRADWQARLRAWGLFPDRQVVLYDDAGGAGAARMWWMLRWGGHGLAAVLDGGWQRWLAEGRPVTRDLPGVLPRGADYSALPALSRAVGADELNGSQLLLDAREASRFRGEQEPIDPVAGHIPGARCAAFSANLRDGVFRDREELRERFRALGATEAGRDVVCYCGSGVTAAHNVLAMVHAGLPEPLLYAGSWSEWITDSSRPVATGD